MQKREMRKSGVAESYRRNQTRPSRRNGKSGIENGKKAWIQFVICGGIFVLLVAVKLLLPTRMEAINERLTAVMERNVDVKAAFSTVGGLFTESGAITKAAEDVYQAVFQTEEPNWLQAKAEYQLDTPIALKELQKYRNVSENAVESEEDKALPEPLMLYSDENLPDSVSMEQVVLGVAYVSPLNGTVSSAFGYRDHPTEGEARFHYGLDIAAETGTPIHCFADGTVTLVGDSSSYGKYCVVSHDNGCSTLYAHCSRITVHAGDAVKKDAGIAEVGESGMATGPHLHFELQKDGVYLNPIYYVV